MYNMVYTFTMVNNEFAIITAKSTFDQSVCGRGGAAHSMHQPDHKDLNGLMVVFDRGASSMLFD